MGSNNGGHTLPASTCPLRGQSQYREAISQTLLMFSNTPPLRVAMHSSTIPSIACNRGISVASIFHDLANAEIHFQPLGASKKLQGQQ
jgi:hypothetical protein